MKKRKQLAEAIGVPGPTPSWGALVETVREAVKPESADERLQAQIVYRTALAEALGLSRDIYWPGLLKEVRNLRDSNEGAWRRYRVAQNTLERANDQLAKVLGDWHQKSWPQLIARAGWSFTRWLEAEATIREHYLDLAEALEDKSEGVLDWSGLIDKVQRERAELASLRMWLADEGEKVADQELPQNLEEQTIGSDQGEIELRSALMQALGHDVASGNLSDEEIVTGVKTLAAKTSWLAALAIRKAAAADLLLQDYDEVTLALSHALGEEEKRGVLSRAHGPDHKSVPDRLEDKILEMVARARQDVDTGLRIPLDEVLIEFGPVADVEEPVFQHDDLDAGTDTPGCDCGHQGLSAPWHGSECSWWAANHG